MQIEDDVVFSVSEFARCLETLGRCLTRRDDFINRIVPFKQRRDPIFKQNVDLGVGQETFEGYKRRSRENRIADRAEPDNKNALYRRPIDHFSTLASSMIITGMSSLTG